MSALTEMLSGPVGQALGWSLVHVTWQGLLVAVGLAAALASSRDSRVRYRYCVAALALLVLAPLATFAVSLASARAADAAVAVAAEGLGAVPGAPAPAGWPLRAPAEPAEPAAPGSPSWLATLTGLWLAGVAAFACRVVLQWGRARQLIRQDVRPAGADIERTLSALVSRLKLTRSVRVLLSTRVDVPLVVGWLAPVVLLPLGATDVLSPAQVRAVLAHELAHVKRLDGLVNLVQAVVEALLFFHPAAWWVSARLRVEREFCCDDVAVAASGSALEYARALATLDALRPDHPEGTGLVPATLSSHGGSLMDRIARLAGRSPARPPRRLLPGATLLLVSALSATGMALATPAGDDCLAQRLDGVQLATGDDGCQLVFARSGKAWSVRCVDEDCADVVTVDVHDAANNVWVEALVADSGGRLVELQAVEADAASEDDGLVTYEVRTDGGDELVIVSRRGVPQPVMVTRKPSVASVTTEPGVVGGYRVQLDDGDHATLREKVKAELGKVRVKLHGEDAHETHGAKAKPQKVKAKIKLEAKGDHDLDEAVQMALDQAAEAGAGAGVYIVEIVDDAGDAQVIEVHATDDPGHGDRDHGDGFHRQHEVRQAWIHAPGTSRVQRDGDVGRVLRIAPKLIERRGGEPHEGHEVFRFDDEGRLLQHDRRGEGGPHGVLLRELHGDDGELIELHSDGPHSVLLRELHGDGGEFIELQDVLIHELHGDEHGDHEYVELEDGNFAFTVAPGSSVSFGSDGDVDMEFEIDAFEEFEHDVGAWIELELDEQEWDEFEVDDGSWFEVGANLFFGDEDDDAADSTVSWFGDGDGVWVTDSGTNVVFDEECDDGVWVTDSGTNVFLQAADDDGVWVTDSGANVFLQAADDDGVWVTDSGANVFFGDGADECGDACSDACASGAGCEADVEARDGQSLRARILFGADDEHELHEAHERFTVRGRVLDHEGHEIRDAKVRAELHHDDHEAAEAPRSVRRFLWRGGEEVELPRAEQRPPVGRRVLRGEREVAPRVMRWRGELPARVSPRRQAPAGLSWRVLRSDERAAPEGREVELHVELRREGESEGDVERRVLRVPAPHGEHEGIRRFRYEVEPSRFVVPAPAPADEQPADAEPDQEVVDVAGVVAT